MTGHETLQLIHERYYSYIRDDGKAFMDNVYSAGKDTVADEKKEKAVTKEGN
jgi:hypothetical protein